MFMMMMMRMMRMRWRRRRRRMVMMVVVVVMMMPNLPTHSFQLAQAAIKDNIQDAGNVETCHWLSGYGSPSLKCQCRGSFPYGGVQESCVAMGTFILRKRTSNRRFLGVSCHLGKSLPFLLNVYLLVI